MHGADPVGQAVEGAGHAADLVVNLRGPIQRHDDFVRAFDNARGIAFQQQAGAQDGGAYAALAQHRREAKQVRVHQRLAAREHHPLDAEPLDIRQVPLQFGGA